MRNGFFGLRHNAIVSRYNQNNDVGGIGTPRTHGGKGLVTRGVKEGNDPARCLDMVGANVLSDSTGLAIGDFCTSNTVEQRRLTVIDVAHDGHDRRTRK